MTKIQDFVEYSVDPYPQANLTNYNLHLYKRNYIGFNLTCLGNHEVNQEVIKIVKEHEERIISPDIVMSITFLMTILIIIYYGMDVSVIVCVSSFFFLLSPVMIISLQFSLKSTNPIFMCVEDKIAEKYIQLQKLDNTFAILNFSLYGLIIFINFICACVISLVRKLRKKSSEGNPQQKEKSELAQLEFTKEDCQEELTAL